MRRADVRHDDFKVIIVMMMRGEDVQQFKKVLWKTSHPQQNYPSVASLQYTCHVMRGNFLLKSHLCFYLHVLLRQKVCISPYPSSSVASLPSSYSSSSSPSHPHLVLMFPVPAASSFHWCVLHSQYEWKLTWSLSSSLTPSSPSSSFHWIILT